MGHTQKFKLPTDVNVSQQVFNISACFAEIFIRENSSAAVGMCLAKNERNYIKNSSGPLRAAQCF